MITTVISGAAPGVDTIAEQLSRQAGVPVERFPADWKTYGDGAGPRRNEQMAKVADALLAVMPGSGPGTQSMIRIASRYGLRIHEYSETTAPPGYGA